MIKQIQNIGEYVEKVYPERSPVESMVNRIKSEDMKYVLIANIQDGKERITLWIFIEMLQWRPCFANKEGSF